MAVVHDGARSGRPSVRDGDTLPPVVSHRAWAGHVEAVSLGLGLFVLGLPPATREQGIWQDDEQGIPRR